MRHGLLAVLGAVQGLMLAGGLVGLAGQSHQAVRGRLLEEATDQPIAGAFIAVLGANGERVAGGLTRDDGSFLVAVPEPGRYRVRAQRIGFRSTESPMIAVALGALVEVDLRAPAEAVEIEGLAVEGGRRCDLRPEAGRETLALWEEARKALDVALWTESGGFIYEIEAWNRRYDRSGTRLVSEQIDHRTHRGRHAFRAVAPESLAERGFVQGSDEDGRSYFAPDAGVLLSNAFLGTHCFEAVEVDGRFGLEFSPLPDREQTDVHGTLWFERGTSRLESLDYRYVNVAEANDGRFGGEVVFEALPGGEWIVREWEIRMPVFTRAFTSLGISRLTVDAVEAAGGRVVEVREPDAGSTLAAPDRPGGATRGTIRGVVVDSTTGRVLEGAVVFISGTNRSARTDTAGAFALNEVPGGRYTLLVDHPRLDELGIRSPTVSVQVEEGTETAVAMNVPSIRRLVADACERVGGEPPGEATAALAGVVQTGGAPSTEIVVRVTWTSVVGTSMGLETREASADVEPDRWGWWGVCRLPADAIVTVKVVRQGRVGPPTGIGRLKRGTSRWLLLDAPSRPLGSPGPIDHALPPGHTLGAATLGST